VFYLAAQFAGAILGVADAALGLGSWLADPAVSYAATGSVDGHGLADQGR